MGGKSEIDRMSHLLGRTPALATASSNARINHRKLASRLRRKAAQSFSALALVVASSLTFASSASAQDPEGAALESVVRSICMNERMEFSERRAALSAMGWVPATSMEQFALLADLEARAMLQADPQSIYSDEEYQERRRIMEKMLAKKLGATEDALDGLVMLQSASLPGVVLALWKFNAGEDHKIEICSISLAGLAPGMRQFIESAFLLSPAKENSLGRYRRMTFTVAGNDQKTWDTSVTELPASDDAENDPLMLKIITRVQEK